MPKIPKGKLVIYVSAETEASLREYQRVHSKRFATMSQAADHLLSRAMSSPVDEGRDQALAPAIRDAVLQAVIEGNERLEREVKGQLDRQTNRLAGMLAKVGVTAGMAARLGRSAVFRAILAQNLVDSDAANSMAAEAEASARTWGVQNMATQLRENERELRDEIRRSGVLLKR